MLKIDGGCGQNNREGRKSLLKSYKPEGGGQNKQDGVWIQRRRETPITHFFFIRIKFVRIIEAQKSPKIKNILRIMLRLNFQPPKNFHCKIQDFTEINTRDIPVVGMKLECNIICTFSPNSTFLLNFDNDSQLR